MPPIYDVSGHDLLSDHAKALTPGQLDGHTLLAETLLGFQGGPDLGDDVTDQAALAIVLQINFQVEQGVDAAVYDSLGQGGRSFSFRDGTVHPGAASLAGLLIGPPASAAWATIRSVRRGNT